MPQSNIWSNGYSGYSWLQCGYTSKVASNLPVTEVTHFFDVLLIYILLYYYIIIIIIIYYIIFYRLNIKK